MFSLKIVDMNSNCGINDYNSIKNKLMPRICRRCPANKRKRKRKKLAAVKSTKNKNANINFSGLEN